MGKKIVMVGNGNYSETLTYYIETFTDWEIVAFTDEFVMGEGKEHKGKPFVNLSVLKEHFPPSDYEVILAVGYQKMNDNRKRLYFKLKEMGYTLPNFIHPTAVIHNTQMGDANIIMENVMFEPNACIGSNIIIWGGVVIGHNTNVGNHNHFAAVSMIAGNVQVGESCFFGNHCTVKDGAKIADYTLIGAGAYAAKDSKPYDVIVPARAVTLEGKQSIDFI